MKVFSTKQVEGDYIAIVQYTQQAYNRSGTHRKGCNELGDIADLKAAMQASCGITDIDQIIAAKQ